MLIKALSDCECGDCGLCYIAWFLVTEILVGDTKATLIDNKVLGNC